ncbi:ABC transporter permease [Luethyella okanaganae]|uniref:ABC transporter permease n=1 Tax=Luethyella okanaganae TaxID=69372 RepID=A0ABW1VHC9_9MICO
MTILGVALTAMLIPNLIATFDPLAASGPRLRPPSSEFLMGTDQLGRDVFSRLVYAARATVPLALSVVVASMLVGGIIGVVAGYFGGVVDAMLMRIADMVFAFPAIILAMAVTAALGAGVTNAVIALVIVSWPAYARLGRSLVMSARNSDYVKASRLLGRSNLTIIRTDLIPLVASQLVVFAAIEVATAILLLAGLSFLGLGVQPPTPEWGSMVADGFANFDSWWIALFPGLAIFLTVVAWNLLGDEVRGHIDRRDSQIGINP